MKPAYMIGAVAAAVAGVSGLFAHVHDGRSTFRIKADRIAEIRGSGARDDGIHTIMQAVKISRDDYFLMGCDNSSARRNYPHLSYEERTEGRWFAGAADLTDKEAGGNSHGTYRRDGTIEIESFYTTLPKRQYQASPEEVAWHYVRLIELRQQNVPQPDRVATMNEEAKARPWEKMQ